VSTPFRLDGRRALVTGGASGIGEATCRVLTEAGASDIIVLRGLSINGQGGNRGIFFQAGARLRVENCVVSGMGAAGISHSAASGEMIVLDTIVRDNGGSGIVVFADIPSAVLDHVRSEHNGGDGFNFGPTSGSGGALATVVDSVFTHNEGKGIGAASVSGGTITLVVERSAMSSNGQDGFAAAAPVGSVAAVNVTSSIANDNGGDGIAIIGDGTSLASLESSAAHRNSGNGLHIATAILGGLVLLLNDNVLNANLTHDVECSSSEINTTGSTLFLSYHQGGACIILTPTKL